MQKEFSFGGKMIMVALLVFVGYVVGWLFGATWGGNYATDVAWFGVRGYESTGAAAGYAFAAAVGIITAIKMAGDRFSLRNAAVPTVVAFLFGLWLPEALQSYELTLFTACFPVLVVLAQGREKEEKHMLGAIFFALLLISNLFMVASLQVPLENIWQASQGEALLPLNDVAPSIE